jgi:hypothetical protein
MHISPEVVATTCWVPKQVTCRVATWWGRVAGGTGSTWVTCHWGNPVRQE